MFAEYVLRMKKREVGNAGCHRDPLVFLTSCFLHGVFSKRKVKKERNMCEISILMHLQIKSQYSIIRYNYTGYIDL